jgi:cell division protein FtsB
MRGEGNGRKSRIWHFPDFLGRFGIVESLSIKRRRRPDLWKKANRYLMALVVVMLLALGAAVFAPERSKLAALEDRLAREKTTLRSEELLKAKRTREVDLLRNDPEYLEIVAREKIGVMKDGETIMRLDPAPAAP